MLIKTRKEAAAALEITERALGDWKKQPGFPDSSKGYDLDKIKAWREEHQRKGSAKDDSLIELNRQIKEEQLEALRLKKREKLLELDETEGKLLPRARYELFIAGLLAGIGDWCEQLPNLIEPLVPVEQAATVRDRLATELRKMRDRLAEDLKREPGDDD